MRQNDFRSAAPVWAALSPLVLWLAAIAAYAYEDGMNLFQWMGRFSQVLERPFAIGWTPYTLKCMLGSLLLYGCGIALYYSSRENRRPGEEYGSAKWGNPKELNRKYMDHQHKDANIILTQRVRLGMWYDLTLFDVEGDFFGKLEQGYSILSVSDLFHCTAWNATEYLADEQNRDKENSCWKGMQRYLNYCKKHGITRNYLVKKEEYDGIDAMKFYDKSAVAKFEKNRKTQDQCR